MSEDRRRPGQHASQRDEALRRWIADEVHPFSAPLRERLDRSGLGRRGVRGAADLARLPVVELDELGDGRDWVLRPTAEAIRTSGGVAQRARLLAADVLGRRESFARRDLDLPYKPVTWTAARHAGGVLLTGWTTTDLDRLAALGRRSLAIAGVVPDDRVACMAVGSGIGPLQLELGARDAGVAHLRVDPGAPLVLHAAAPTVVSATPSALRTAVDVGLPPSVRLLVAHVGAGDDSSGLRELRREAGVEVRLWWAPTGTRAAWVTCAADQLHTWPDHEHLEVVDDADDADGAGRLVWSAVAWRGSVWLRVALGPLGRIDRGTCACGRTTPRVQPARRRMAAIVR